MSDTGFVYRITNKINGKCYIGQSCQKHGRRIKEHFNDAFNQKKIQYNCLFYRAIRKYGIDSWDYEVVTDGITKDELDWLEIACILFYNSFGKFGYNSDSGGRQGKQYAPYVRKKISDTEKGRTSPMKGRKHTEEARKKISAAGIGRVKPEESLNKLRGRKYPRGQEHYNYGKSLNDSTKEKISESHMGMKQTDESRKKISYNLKNNKSMPRGEKHHNSKLTWELVNSIRERFVNGDQRYNKLAKEYGVALTTVKRLLQCETWNDNSNLANKCKDLILKLEENGHKTAKLTWDLIREIRSNFAAGNYTKTQLAKEYGVDRTNISQIIHNKTWIE